MEVEARLPRMLPSQGGRASLLAITSAAAVATQRAFYARDTTERAIGADGGETCLRGLPTAGLSEDVGSKRPIGDNLGFSSEKEVARASRGIARTTSRGSAPWETNRAKPFAAHCSEKAVRPTGEPRAEPPSHQDSRVEGGTRVSRGFYAHKLLETNGVSTVVIRTGGAPASFLELKAAQLARHPEDDRTAFIKWGPRTRRCRCHEPRAPNSFYALSVRREAHRKLAFGAELS